MNQLWKAAGAAAWGAAALGGLQPFLGPEAAEQLHTLCPGAQTVLVGAFPYYAGQAPAISPSTAGGRTTTWSWAGGWSRSAPGSGPRHPSHTFVAGADNSPVPELAAAELAGVGCRGRHGLRIVPPYGSYVFLGTILTDLVLPSTGPSAETLCPPHCRACQAACPTGALTEQGCEVTRCLSDLTQRKGPLPPEAAEQVRRSPTVWGCDLCQKACPHNQAAALTPLPEFREDLLCSLTLAELEPLSNKGFPAAVCPPGVFLAGDWALRRNLALKEETAPAEEEDRPSS